MKHFVPCAWAEAVAELRVDGWMGWQCSDLCFWPGVQASKQGKAASRSGDEETVQKMPLPESRYSLLQPKSCCLGVLTPGEQYL